MKVFVCDSYLIFPFLHISSWSLIVLFLKLSMQSVRFVCLLQIVLDYQIFILQEACNHICICYHMWCQAHSTHKQFSISSMHRLDRTIKLDTCNEMIWPCQSSLFHKNPSNLSSGVTESILALCADSPLSTLSWSPPRSRGIIIPEPVFGTYFCKCWIMSIICSVTFSSFSKIPKGI